MPDPAAHFASATTAIPRPSASVVLVRADDARTSWETYLLRRHSASPVLAESWVFPGGTIRADDQDLALADRSPRLTPEGARAALSRSEGEPPPDPAESFGYFVAAARELFEESGVLLATPPDSQSLCRYDGTLDEVSRLSSLRLDLEHGRSFLEVLDELRLSLALDRLVHYAHWVTPPTVPSRFDTRFFVAVLPEGQFASPSPFEMGEGEWISPQAALQSGRSGERSIHFATAAQLRRLGEFQSLDDLLRFASTKLVRRVMPTTREINGRHVPFLPPEIDGNW